jgi:hypothetical protein
MAGGSEERARASQVKDPWRSNEFLVLGLIKVKCSGKKMSKWSRTLGEMRAEKREREARGEVEGARERATWR